ncbi:1-acyl-sn-glycerol-3-phosphate acyltransferase [Bacillus sp. ISL-40]|uniref:lysophospholipid acyltransferase family protein n=1 Tax=unclassified Bacillus (in: firmicutes) TaxID=185979 RepID=UPI001BE81BD4|nr:MULTISPECIES: lysophospholipid acyltransferase family protein [unclassified Bacillus (in: firmicutes)]MBT2698921.1 1-acyl-sn-glycerol-3-phosphate acyltransferase [Bacillus sp. ISL-40]MBT2721630.1 1-acyl-sn-glycerol-3-phosphate acyltransferase [Bacillus sp. ISL-46]MBT2744573.1 1-acyl-sn-glycerol-3-phosphate acyltransferase [Bacillus sp. ISL-77]
MTFYAFARSVVYGVFKPWYRIEAIGREHFPKEGGVLLCSNHIHNFDPMVVGIMAPRPIHYMAKEEIFSVPVLGNIVRKCNAFPVKRGFNDREALRTGLKLLKDGHVFGLFPEGTRSKTGELGKGLSGAGFFALRSTAAVVPCAIIGPYRSFRKLKVVYGQPIDLEEMRKEKASAEQVTELIMSEIEKLKKEHQ